MGLQTYKVCLSLFLLRVGYGRGALFCASLRSVPQICELGKVPFVPALGRGVLGKPQALHDGQAGRALCSAAGFAPAEHDSNLVETMIFVAEANQLSSRRSRARQRVALAKGGSLTSPCHSGRPLPDWTQPRLHLQLHLAHYMAPSHNYLLAPCV